MKRVLSYVLVFLLGVSLTLGVYFFMETNGSDSNKLLELEKVIENRFVEDVDMGELEDAAASAMVDALEDRWSYYMTAESYQSYLERMANAYVGIGVTAQADEDGRGITVKKVTENGPAEQAGVLVGDLITAVDGTDISGMTVTQASALIKGTEGTTVKLTLLRAGGTLELTVTRKAIQTAVATGRMLEGNVGLVRIANFDSRCYDETVSAIEALLEQGAEKLIFDVRYNGGGYKSELVKLLDYLLPEGVIFRSESSDGTTSEDVSDTACLEMPMAVLINGGSYSAAEFFAAALQEYDWAITVGEPTSGKGHFQNTFRLSDGSAVNISVGRYYTPKGVSLDGVGLTPDVEVPVDTETANQINAGTLDPMEDPQILAALQALGATETGKNNS